jgi:hypothetical protein
VTEQPKPSTDEVRNLHQRLIAVAKQIGSLAPSGKDQYGKVALSIYDVEEAVRKPLAEAGVITRWSYISLEPQEKLWIAHLAVCLVNADDPADVQIDEWIDVGSNPMAATSFARKGYYKALFHLDDKESDADKGDRTPPAEGARTVASAPHGTPREEWRAPCPKCGEPLAQRKSKKGEFVSCTSWKSREAPGCGFTADGTLADFAKGEAELGDAEIVHTAPATAPMTDEAKAVARTVLEAYNVAPTQTRMRVLGGAGCPDLTSAGVIAWLAKQSVPMMTKVYEGLTEVVPFAGTELPMSSDVDPDQVPF